VIRVDHLPEKTKNVQIPLYLLWFTDPDRARAECAYRWIPWPTAVELYDWWHFGTRWTNPFARLPMPAAEATVVSVDDLVGTARYDGYPRWVTLSALPMLNRQAQDGCALLHRVFTP
jgi:hypothetical protein